MGGNGYTSNDQEGFHLFHCTISLCGCFLMLILEFTELMAFAGRWGSGEQGTFHI